MPQRQASRVETVQRHPVPRARASVPPPSYSGSRHPDWCVDCASTPDPASERRLSSAGAACALLRRSIWLCEIKQGKLLKDFALMFHTFVSASIQLPSSAN
jgi:hypothetical protein